MKKKPSFAVIVSHPGHELIGHYLQGPRTPQKVKKDGYGFTSDPSQVWPFPSETAAQAKARIVARHMSWGDEVLNSKPQIP
jgi:hypothetical protein